MPKRSRGSGTFVVSFSMPVEEQDLIKTLDLIAAREGKSRSEVIVEAIREYIITHEGKNPAVPLTEFTSPIDDLELACFKATLKSLISRAPRTEQAVKAYGQRWIAEVLRILPRARRLMARSGDKELTSMVEQLSRMVKQMTGR